MDICKLVITWKVPKQFELKQSTQSILATLFVSTLSLDSKEDIHEAQLSVCVCVFEVFGYDLVHSSCSVASEDLL